MDRQSNGLVLIKLAAEGHHRLASHPPLSCSWMPVTVNSNSSNWQHNFFISLHTCL